MQRKRPTAQPRVRKAPPVWQDQQADWRQQPYSEPAWQDAPQEPYMEEPPYEEPAYEEQPYEEPYAEAPYEPYFEPEGPTRVRPQPEVIATNTAIRLTCTLCAMCGLLAIFMCWAEKESRAIRHFAVQSAAVTGLHVLCGLALFLVSGLLGSIPFLGFLLTMVCWLVYFALLVVIVVVRARMMLHAWRGIRFTLPGLWRTLERFC